MLFDDISLFLVFNSGLLLEWYEMIVLRHTAFPS
jgi:hypothetical protein